MINLKQLAPDLTSEELKALKKAWDKINKGGRIYNLKQIGDELGITSKMVGVIADRNNIRTDVDNEYCFWVLEEIPLKKGSKTENVPKFTKKGREAIIRCYNAGL